MDARLWKRRLRDAAKTNDAARLRLLLAQVPAGESVDAAIPGSGRASAVMVAAWFGSPEACEILLAAGADPCLRSEHGRSAQAVGVHERPGRTGADLARTRALVEAFAPGREAPSPYSIRLLVLPGTEGEEVMDAVDTLAGREFGLRVNWVVTDRRDAGEDGHLWLLDDEAGLFERSLSSLADSRKDFTFSIAPPGTAEEGGT